MMDPVRLNSSELPRVTEPISAPTALQSLVEDYNLRAKLGESSACALLLKDALGYFLRYYAAVCVAACRELECLPAEVAHSWGSAPSVEAAGSVLHECLERLKTHSERIARKLTQVFYEQDGDRRAFTQYFFPQETRPDFLLVEFCVAPREQVMASDFDTLCQAARILDAWISASFAFFLESEQRLETGAYFGQLEQVVCFEQYTLRTGLTMRVHESRGVAALPALVPQVATALAGEPQAQAPAPGLAVEPVVEVPESMPQPEVAPEAVSEAVVAAAPLAPVAVEAEALQKFVQSQRNVVRPKTEAVPVKKVKPVGESRLDIRLEPLGFMRSKQGKVGYGGFLWVSSTDGEPIVGVVKVTGGNVELTPVMFEGTSNRVVYWVSPDDVAFGKEYLQVNADGEERLYALWKLAPPSRFENLSRPKQAGLLMLPGLVGVIYSGWTFYSTEKTIDAQLRETLGANFSTFINSTQPLSLRRAGIGELDVDLKPRVESTLLVFLLVAWLVPVVVAKLYSRYPRRDQKALLILFVLGCCWPCLVYLMLWSSPLTQSPVTQHPELAQMDFRRSMALFATLNGLSSLYVMVSVEGVFHRFLNTLGRITLATVLALSAALGILWQVYGSSWFE